MIYPPTNSVFYRLNPIECVSPQRRKAFNPLLTPKEIEAIYRSFQIIEKNKIIKQQVSANRFEEKTFAQIIHDTLVFANKLPTARPWLRVIPANIKLSFRHYNELNATADKEGICFSDNTLQKPVSDLVSTFMHELAHVSDRTCYTPLSPYPFEPINDGKAHNFFDYKDLSETETITLFLVEEAEKAALSAQIDFEAHSQEQLFKIYTPFFQKAFSHYLKVFDRLSFNEKSSSHTAETERKSRALYYASLNARAEYMKWLLKPYTHYLKQLPKAVLKECRKPSKIVSLLHLQKISEMNLTDYQLEKTAQLISKIIDYLTYQSRSYNFLLESLYQKFQKAATIDNSLTPQEIWKAFLQSVDNKRIRHHYFNNNPTRHYVQFTEFMEARYLGFLKAEDLMPHLNATTVYLKQCKNEPRKAMIAWELSQQIAQLLIKDLKKQYQKYLIPYYHHRLQEYLKSHRQKQRF